MGHTASSLPPPTFPTVDLETNSNAYSELEDESVPRVIYPDNRNRFDPASSDTPRLLEFSDLGTSTEPTVSTRNLSELGPNENLNFNLNNGLPSIERSNSPPLRNLLSVGSMADSSLDSEGSASSSLSSTGSPPADYINSRRRRRSSMEGRPFNSRGLSSEYSDIDDSNSRHSLVSSFPRGRSYSNSDISSNMGSGSSLTGTHNLNSIHSSVSNEYEWLPPRRRARLFSGLDFDSTQEALPSGSVSFGLPEYLSGELDDIVSDAESENVSPIDSSIENGNISSNGNVGNDTDEPGPHTLVSTSENPTAIPTHLDSVSSSSLELSRVRSSTQHIHEDYSFDPQALILSRLLHLLTSARASFPMDTQGASARHSEERSSNSDTTLDVGLNSESSQNENSEFSYGRENGEIRSNFRSGSLVGSSNSTRYSSPRRSTDLTASRSLSSVHERDSESNRQVSGNRFFPNRYRRPFNFFNRHRRNDSFIDNYHNDDSTYDSNDDNNNDNGNGYDRSLNHDSNSTDQFSSNNSDNPPHSANDDNDSNPNPNHENDNNYHNNNNHDSPGGNINGRSNIWSNIFGPESNDDSSLDPLPSSFLRIIHFHSGNTPTSQTENDSQRHTTDDDDNNTDEETSNTFHSRSAPILIVGLRSMGRSHGSRSDGLRFPFGNEESEEREDDNANIHHDEIEQDDNDDNEGDGLPFFHEGSRFPMGLGNSENVRRNRDPLQNRYGDGDNTRSSRAFRGSSPRRSWLVWVFGSPHTTGGNLFLRAPSLFSDNPTYEDLMAFESYMGQVKPPVATRADVANDNGVFKYVRPECHNNEEGDRCQICLAQFESQDLCRKLINCDHFFHKECVDRWLMDGRNSCPLCRRVGIATKEMKTESESQASGTHTENPSFVSTSVPGAFEEL
ncbi:hypothetical protein NADFUDRAFT_77169 [Nadsonia fulvescens var. elongata DSM 6958]|uniref:RING-type domain-containing protein n=1 Tax=Nadsonia fulvescens var. elongata DSM 6958 TaxID=857566 RepID=A0A1E3PQF5_9ASCO|nr:hypothetical protein NADFUDRAFT_77169 [Nadsonia fulvescens var. elongata DSM 6958]